MNTTFVVDKRLTDKFLLWVRETYMPLAEKSGVFGNGKILRVHQEIDPMADSIAVQLEAEELHKAEQWHEAEAAEVKNRLRHMWGERVLFFTTYMTVL